jgi:hypothetical protein
MSENLEYKTRKCQRRANEKYRNANREKLRAYARAYYHKNKERIRARENALKREKRKVEKIAKYKAFLKQVENE